MIALSEVLMNHIENKAIRDQIYFERYKNGEANKVVELLDSSNRELAKYVKQTTDVATKKRYVEIARKLRDVSKTLRNKVESGTDIDGLIDYELKRQKSLLKSIVPEIKRTAGGEVNFLYPTREQIKTAALFRPADTKSSLTFQSYLDGIESGLYNNWDSAVRTGYITGIPTTDIVDYVVGKASKPGAISSLKNSVYSNTRTMLQSFANETRNRIYEENEQYFGGKSEYKYEYLATLDARTCIVCGDMDGKLFRTLKDCPILPMHRGCRCIVVPYFDIDEETRASKNGQVDSRIKFSDWLSEQDEKTQAEVLGKSKFVMYKRGVKISQFVDSGKVLSLKELSSFANLLGK